MDTGQLDRIATFEQLIAYLRDELDWPIEDEDFDHLTFDYSPAELGLKPEESVKLLEVKQLRPLVTDQPWGIFFLNFDRKALPVTVLRRILGKLTLKKRASANAAERAAWRLHDLLFISAHGEAGRRQLSFAHFKDDAGMGDLPALRVLGWNDDDTVRRLSATHATLKDRLRWRDAKESLETWRERWSGAFTERPREAARTAEELANALAGLARDIRARANTLMSVSAGEKIPQ